MDDVWNKISFGLARKNEAAASIPLIAGTVAIVAPFR